MSLTHTTREGRTHDLELVRRSDTPRFFAVRFKDDALMTVRHMDSSQISINGVPATHEALDWLLNPART